jgi:hypothetical protein
MNTQLPPIEPLDEQEREFARIVRALPGGDPPAALDARILKTAANAAASSRRPTSRLLASAGALWGIGGAAAAVLALGVSWQMMYPTQPSSAPEAATAAKMSDQADDSSVSVEFKEEAPREFDNSGPPPPPALAKVAPGARPQRQLDAPASAPAAPAPEPFALDKLDEHVADSAEAGASSNAMAAAPIVAEQESRDGYAAKSSAAERRANVVGSAAAPPASMAADTRARSEMAQAQLSRSDAQDRAAVASGGAAAETSAAATGVLAAKPDSRLLKPIDWLNTIRRLRDDNHRAEAKASLIEFRRRYPYYSIPPDLAPLLR